MASAFWTLENGRVFSRRCSVMACILELITDELEKIEDAGAFYQYLKKFVYRAEKGDAYNGYGGFIRGNENIMFNLDWRTFAPGNSEFFWQATQMALAKLKIKDGNPDDGIIFSLNILMDMHKRINRREDPMELNDSRIISPKPNIRFGPEW
jgi:hypothetical protein